MIFCNEPPILCGFEMSLKLEEHICKYDTTHGKSAHYTHTSEPHLMAFVSANVHQKWASEGVGDLAHPSVSTTDEKWLDPRATTAGQRATPWREREAMDNF